MSANGCFVKQCTKCGATTLRGSANCPWCGVEQKREVFKAPAPVSNEWLPDNPYHTGEKLSYSRLVREQAFDEGATAQLRKVAERIKSRRDPLSPEYTGGVIEIILNQDEYHALLQEAGLEARE